MTQYVAISMVFFDGADGTDAWARGQAQWVADNTKTLTGQALVTPGGAGERSSYCVVARVDPDGSLTTLDGWHVNDNGALVEAPPGEAPAPDAPEWQDGTSYVVGDLVTYEGTVYRCISDHTSSLAANWVPGIAHSLWEVA